MDPALRARLFRTDSDAWNNENYVFVGGPLLAVVGVLVGGAIALPMDLSPVHELLIFVVCVGVSMSIGLTLLALIDMETDSTSS